MRTAPPESALVRTDPPQPAGAAAPALTSPARPLEEGLRERAWGLIRMLLVGLWSSGVDLIVLAMCVRWFHVQATLSRLVALLVSGLLLFFGCRSFAFRAQAGSISRQARLFVLAEALGFPLNLLVFHALAVYLPFVAPELSSQAANFLVFLGFSYPMRRLVIFRVAGAADGSSARERYPLPLLPSG